MSRNLQPGMPSAFRAAGFTILFRSADLHARRAEAARHHAHHQRLIHLSIRPASHDRSPAHTVGLAGRHLAWSALAHLMCSLRVRHCRREGGRNRGNGYSENDFLDHVSKPRFRPLILATQSLARRRRSLQAVRLLSGAESRKCDIFSRHSEMMPRCDSKIKIAVSQIISRIGACRCHGRKSRK
jgi:hypothetical protein